MSAISTAGTHSAEPCVAARRALPHKSGPRTTTTVSGSPTDVPTSTAQILKAVS